ncbi:MAG TPA: hypothetical protein VLC09_02315 [Polyangiaceae bacterium]|nr:hypothetical protein [Polyangiaceae bacterium]
MSVASISMAVLTGCGADPHADAAFGGQGANVQQKESALPPEDTKHYGACTGPAPASDTVLLDDFEDGDHKPFRGFHREAWWFTVSDKTPGSKIHPDSNFLPERLPAGEGNAENQWAAHVTAEGQTTWGMTFSTSLHYAKDGLKCPFNAAAFDGVRFRAKGPGKVAVAFPLPETVKDEAGGVCTEGCYDTHRQVVYLTEGWAEYTVLWSKVQQGGWGTEVRFDPERLLGINFAVQVADLPIDFWIDDVDFVPRAGSSTAK